MMYKDKKYLKEVHVEKEFLLVSNLIWRIRK